MGHSHSPYLEDIPLSTALDRWWSALDEAGVGAPLEGECVALDEATGRVTSEPVWAVVSSPHYHAAAMDGYAVVADATRGASETSPVLLSIGTTAFYVDTGDPMPPGTNAVIMVEDTQLRQGEQVEIMSAVAPWQHVRPMGEDMVATELILPANHRMRPQDIGAAAGSGHSELLVRRKPRVAILPTGTELVSPGRVAASRRHHRVQLAGAGRDGARVGRRGDPAAAAGRRLPGDSRADRFRCADPRPGDRQRRLVGRLGGLHRRIVEELGELLVHGIAIRPGHPVILGMVPGRTKGDASSPSSACPATRSPRPSRASCS